MKDSVWSVDLFRCESIALKSHWILIVMDLYTRQIVGLSVNRGDIDGATLCFMFNKIAAKITYPKSISTDHDPLFRFHRCQVNLCIIKTDEIKAIPYVPISHPFIERLIGTVRREYLDHTLFWTARDLQQKLDDLQNYFNNHRTHSSLGGKTPIETDFLKSNLSNFEWRNYCRGLFKLPCPT